MCVLFTASDAYIRDYTLMIPSDCVAAIDASEHRFALRHMKRVLKADIRKSSDLDLRKLQRKSS
jgi:nicotinamidase-related amidase